MKISVQCRGFRLDIDYDPNDPFDQEIMAEVFNLLRRRKKA